MDDWLMALPDHLQPDADTVIEYAAELDQRTDDTSRYAWATGMLLGNIRAIARAHVDDIHAGAMPALRRDCQTCLKLRPALAFVVAFERPGDAS